MWQVKTDTKFKNSFFPVLIYWNDIEIHLGFKNSGLSPPSIFSLMASRLGASKRELAVDRLQITIFSSYSGIKESFSPYSINFRGGACHIPKAA